MSTAKILISLPTELSIRFKNLIPPRKRSAIVQNLLQKELDKMDRKLYKCAQAVEKDAKLNQEMQDWDSTINDGLDDETW
jgi:hypothetical protein